MITKRDFFTVVLTFCLTLALFMVASTRSGPIREYDRWADINGDGKINYLDLGILISPYRYGTTGDNVSLASLAYDSEWLNITDKCGQYFNITHGLNSTDIMVDITGKTTIDGGAHQKYLGLTGYASGWIKNWSLEDFDVVGGIQTSDGGYAFVCNILGDGIDSMLVKTDGDGDWLWNKTYTHPGNDYAASVVQTHDGGYAILSEETANEENGNDMGQFRLVKTDSEGDAQWNRTYGGSGIEMPRSIAQTEDDGFALGGSSDSFGEWGPWLIKTDVEGNAQWNKTYGAGSPQVVFGWTAIPTSDSGYALFGSARSETDDNDFKLIKTDADGITQWNRTYEGTTDDSAYSLVQTADGGFTMAGTTYTPKRSFLLIKTDMNGVMEWNKTYEGVPMSCATVGCQPLALTAEGGYALAGHILLNETSRPLFIKTDAGGNMQWSKTYDSLVSELSYCGFSTIIQNVDSSYILAGDGYCAKTDAESGLAWTDSTANTITLCRGESDIYWNFVRVRIWKIKP